MDDYPVDGSNALDPNYDDPHYTTANNPGKQALQSAKDDIRPKLQIIEGGKEDDSSNNDTSTPSEKPHLSVIDGGKSNSAHILGNAEKNASQLPLANVDSDSSDTKSDARTNENIGTPGFINNVGSALKSKVGIGNSSKQNGWFRKKAPIMLLLTALLGGSIGVYSAQSILPFALVNRIKQEFNSQHVSLNRRYKYIFNRQLNTNLKKKNTSFLGHLKITKKQKKFLKKQGIETKKVTVEYDGKKRTHNILIVDNHDGTSKIITGSNKKFNKALEQAMSSSKAPKVIKDLNLGTNTKPISFKKAIKTDIDFTNRFVNGSRGVAGHVAGWFDSIIDGVRKRISFTRNRWLNIDRREGDFETEKKYNALAKTPDDKLTGPNLKIRDEQEKTNEDGEKVKETVEVADGQEKADTRQATIDNITSKVNAASKVTGVATTICAIQNAISTINTIKYAAEMVQILNYTSGFLEAIQKGQVGEGDKTTMNEYLNDLSKKDSSGLTGLSAEGIGFLINGTNVDTENAYIDTPKNNNSLLRSKIQAESALKFNTEDTRVSERILSAEGIMKLINKDGKTTIAEMKKCNHWREADAVANVVMWFIPGVGWAAKAVDAIADTITQATVNQAIKMLSSFLIPKVADMITRDLVTGVVGPDLGNALAAGANVYLSKNHQGAGGSPGDQNSVFAFKRAQNQVIAEDARAERSVKSPFDATTNSTFLGNITYSLLPLATSFTSISNTVTNLNNIASSSLTKILPSASAAGETQLISKAGDCPAQNDIGVFSDQYCNPFFTSDLDTTELDPLTITYGIWDMKERKDNGEIDKSSPIGYENFQTTEVGDHTEIEYDQYGNPIISQDIKKSNLLKYAKYCGERDSIFGTADDNITQSLNDGELLETTGTVSTFITDNAPIVSDAKDFLEALRANDNQGWIGGSYCIATSNKKTNPRWDENRLYQRFLEDQRLFESIGVIDQEDNQTTIAHQSTNNYSASQPDLISRFSGLSEQTIADTLDLVDYYNFIAEYDPSSLYPSYKDKVIYFVSSLLTRNILPSQTSVSTLSEAPIYVDLRNRNFGI